MMKPTKTYVVIGPTFDGHAETVLSLEAATFDLLDNGPMILFKDAQGTPMALHNLAPAHTITIR